MAIRHPGLLGTAAFVLATTLAGAPAPAQEPSEPPSSEGPEAAEPPPAETAEDEGFRNRLWVFSSFGSGSADDVNTSIKNASLINAGASAPDALSAVSLSELDHARVEVGWQLPEQKGDFRLRFNGFSEKKYEFETQGRNSKIAGGASLATPATWWTLRAEDGTLRAVKNPPRLINGQLTYLAPDDPANTGYASYQLAITDDLLNRAQHWEVLYGRTWGGRRYSGRWWSGLRYFQYEGNLLAGSWLNLTVAGQGFTDGLTLRLLNFTQETTGVGPTGMMEANFNFFDRRLVLYLNGQLAFMFTDLQTDSGPFFTLVNQTSTSSPIPTRLNASREKSSWHTAGEAGARWNFRSGLTIELAYQVTGYLDAILLPSQLPIPNDDTQEPPQGDNTLFATHDLVFESWRVGLGFQF